MSQPHPIENLRLLSIRLSAPNDPSGNPRDAYLVLDKGTGRMVDVVDGEYSECQAVTEKYPGVTMGITIQVAYREYRL